MTGAVALENARIVQAPGRVVDRGTVLFRNGRIVAVGIDVTIPYDAERIHGVSVPIDNQQIRLYREFLHRDEGRLTPVEVAPPVH